MKNLLLILSLLLSATACKKEQADVVPQIPATVTELDPNDSYPAGTFDNADGFFNLTSFTTLAVQHFQKTEAQFTGSIKDGNDFKCIGILPSPVYDNEGNWVAQLAEKKCGSFSINDDLFDISGTNILFTTSAQTFDKVLRFHIYMPENIKITKPTFTNDLTIAPGQTMTWTTDTKNLSHDVLEINYNPEQLENVKFSDNGYNKPIRKMYRVHNTLGKYTFTEADFAGMPKGAGIDIKLMRYTILERTDIETSKNYYIITGGSISLSPVLNY